MYDTKRWILTKKNERNWTKMALLNFRHSRQKMTWMACKWQVGYIT